MIEVDWQRDGFPSQQHYEQFLRARDWIQRTQLHRVDQQVQLLMRCGLVPADMMIVVWPDGDWQFALQPHRVRELGFVGGKT